MFSQGHKKPNAVLLSNVRSQKQLEPTDKCASCHEARDNKTVCGDMMVPTIKRHREGKLQTKRIQISHDFPSASNHFTHCWAGTQNPRSQLIHLQSIRGILSTGHVDKVHVVLKESRHNQQVQQLEKRVGMRLATVVYGETVNVHLHLGSH